MWTEGLRKGLIQAEGMAIFHLKSVITGAEAGGGEPFKIAVTRNFIHRNVFGHAHGIASVVFRNGIGIDIVFGVEEGRLVQRLRAKDPVVAENDVIVAALL